LAAYDCFAGVGSCAPLAGCFTGSFSGVAGFAFSSAGFSGVVADGLGFVMKYTFQYHGNILPINIRSWLDHYFTMIKIIKAGINNSGT
jgi:hypothetical protein